MSDSTPHRNTNDLDYELADELATDTAERMKALGDPLRLAVADLVLERAMTVTEISKRVGRPRGTVAHHVDVLVEAGLLRVVRTRKVRAIEERFYGRTARTFVLDHSGDDLPFVHEAQAQIDRSRDDLPAGSTFRHARIPAERAEQYIARLHALAIEFTEEQRAGATEFGLMFHVFPTNRNLAPAGDEPGETP